MRNAGSSPNDTSAGDGDAHFGTRVRLLTEAARLFRAKGYASTTTRELAAAVGIQKGSLYYYAPNKEDLLFTICREPLIQAIAELEAVAATNSPPLSKLRAAITLHLRRLHAAQDQFAVAFLEFKSLSAARRYQVIALRDHYESVFRSIVRAGQHDREIRADVSDRDIGIVLLSVVNWTVFWFDTSQRTSPDELADTLYQTVIGGIGLRDARP